MLPCYTLLGLKEKGIVGEIEGYLILLFKISELVYLYSVYFYLSFCVFTVRAHWVSLQMFEKQGLISLFHVYSALNHLLNDTYILFYPQNILSHSECMLLIKILYYSIK